MTMPPRPIANSDAALDSILESDDFVPAWWTIPLAPFSGDVQTIAATRGAKPRLSAGHIEVPVGHGEDADRILLHVDEPSGVRVRGNVLLLHGITGCHASSYMSRLSIRFNAMGLRTFRIDARGCGLLTRAATTITHAGRSDDAAAALSVIARDFAGPLHAIGVSLGGNQLLRMAGRIGAAVDPRPAWWQRLTSIAAIAPPVDLAACASNMDRRRNSLYNRYFIASLLKRIPDAIRHHRGSRIDGSRPRTLRQLDDRLTAPVAGFGDASNYYRQCSSAMQFAAIDIPTLMIVSRDDPIIPFASYQTCIDAAGPNVRWCVTRRGGHAAYIGPRRSQWLDDRLARWIGANMIVAAPSSPAD